MMNLFFISNHFQEYLSILYQMDIIHSKSLVTFVAINIMIGTFKKKHDS